MKLRATYGSRFEKRRDLLIGFVGWFVVSGVIALALKDQIYGGNKNLGICLTPVNLIALFSLVFWREWMALGWLAAYALNLLVALVMSQQISGAACGLPFFGPLK